jgi:DSF synthase
MANSPIPATRYLPFGGMLRNPDWGIGRPKTHRGRPGRVEAPDAAERLFSLRQLEVTHDKASDTLWTFMKPEGRPSYNPDMLADFHSWQDGITAKFGEDGTDLRYLVLGSRFPGVFSFGGDLRLFAQKIRQRDREALVGYGNSCVEILHRNMGGLGLPIVTIGLVQGDALGGGFESLLSFDVIVAEKGAKFGFPEILFGLFPGMGAFSFLARRIGSNKAQELILSGKTYSAEEMHAMGVVHILVEPGQGEQAVRDYIARSSRRHNGHRAIYQAAREVDRISLLELRKIVSIWADAALKLREQDLKVMERLVSAQDRLGVASAAAAA